jgi:hypothetical protein
MITNSFFNLFHTNHQKKAITLLPFRNLSIYNKLQDINNKKANKKFENTGKTVLFKYDLTALINGYFP